MKIITSIIFFQLFISTNAFSPSVFSKQVDDKDFINTGLLPGSMVYFSGRTLDYWGKSVPNVRLDLYEGDSLVGKNVSLHNGGFVFLLKPEKEFILRARKKGYEVREIAISTKNLDKKSIKKDIVLYKKQIFKVCIADREDKHLLDSVKVIATNKTLDKQMILYTKKSGCVEFKTPVSQRHKEVYYLFEFRKKNYLPKREIFHDTLKSNPVVTIRQDNSPVYMIKQIFNPIYFDLGKTYIRKDAAVELDKIVRLLKKYPEIKLSIESHTDARNSAKSNLLLSEKRANSTMQYFIKQGISPDRLQAKGFGESRPVNKCVDGVKCTEKEYQENRRTEFVIIN